MVFQIISCISFSTSTSQFLLQMAVSTYLQYKQAIHNTSVVIDRYRTPRLNKFRQLFFSFRKVWDYPHRLHRDSLTLTTFSFNYFEVCLILSVWIFLVEGYLLPLIFKLI